MRSHSSHDRVLLGVRRRGSGLRVSSRAGTAVVHERLELLVELFRGLRLLLLTPLPFRRLGGGGLPTAGRLGADRAHAALVGRGLALVAGGLALLLSATPYLSSGALLRNEGGQKAYPDPSLARRSRSGLRSRRARSELGALAVRRCCGIVVSKSIVIGWSGWASAWCADSDEQRARKSSGLHAREYATTDRRNRIKKT
jgi:hypothetical protein